jgi:hypothetical protein
MQLVVVALVSYLGFWLMPLVVVALVSYLGFWLFVWGFLLLLMCLCQ